MAATPKMVILMGFPITNFRVMESRRDGICHLTGQKFAAGTEILYKSGQNVTRDEAALFARLGFPERERWGLTIIWEAAQAADGEEELPVAPPPRVESRPAARPEPKKGADEFEPSEYQEKIRHFLLKTAKNILISALAGCGKTATLVWLCWVLKKMGLLRDREVYFLAFNASIRDEVIPKLKGSDVTPLTTHQFCNRKVLSYKIDRLEKNKGERNRRIFLKVVKDILNVSDDWEAKRSGYWKYRKTTLKLVPLIKNWAILPTFDGTGWVFDDAARAQIHGLFKIYRNLEVDRQDPENFKKQVVNLACSVISYSLPAPGITPLEYDFDDMLYHVLVFEVPIPKVDLVFVDEVQDWNATQLRILAKMEAVGTRIVAVGDKNQAIYMFRGAYARAWEALLNMLQGSRRGLEICELPINYRSEPEVLDYALELVPGLIPHKPRTGKGRVSLDTTFDDMMRFFREENSQPKPRKMAVLCRTRAPLVQAGYAAIGEGQKVFFLGKGDLTKPLHDLINDVAGYRDNPRCNRIADRRDDRDGSILEEGFLTLLGQYVRNEKAKYEGHEDASELLEELTDNAECLRVIAQFVKEDTVEAIRREIDSRFVEKAVPGSITFTTGHGAKGLQWGVVFIIRKDLMPHPSVKPCDENGNITDEYQQEVNLDYIARTRAEQETHVVCTWPFGKGMGEILDARPQQQEEYDAFWGMEPETEAPRYNDNIFNVPDSPPSGRESCNSVSAAVDHPTAAPPAGWGVRSGGPVYPMPPVERAAEPVRREPKRFVDDGEPF